ncbi:MAG: cytochrome c oxidase subunit 3 [Chloroflexota bacterium]|nr:cytochrome c oxidase subunit 3 [Chloroflexota bacterium]
MAHAPPVAIDRGAAAAPPGEAALVLEHPHPSVGVDNRKLLMWAFLASDCMFFGTLIATYLVYKNRSLDGPLPRETFDIPYTSVSAFVLLLSSLTMVLALSHIQRGNERKMRIWLTTTALLGCVFLGGQFYEFNIFYREGLTLSRNLFGSTFFTLTGFHGTHVFIGVFWLLSLVAHSLRGRLHQEHSIFVEIAGLYWHFVDIVWILIFTLVYLIPE